MFRFFFLLLLLLILPDLYIWWNFSRLHSGIWRTLLLALPTLLTLIFMITMMCQVRMTLLMQWAFILLICVAVPKLVFVIVDLLGRGLTLNHQQALPYVHRTALSLSVLMAALQVYGTAFGWQRMQTQHTRITLPTLPEAFKGYKIVQISDIHLGTYAGSTRVMQAMVDSVNKQQPDLIVFTGDMVNTASDEALPYLRTLRQLRAKDGVLSILGNHDYCLYQPGLSPQEQAAEVQRIVRMQKAMGWHVLLNEHVALSRGSDTIFVAGVENVGKPPFPERGNLKKALLNIPSQACTVLLSHDPWHWRHEVLTQPNVALTLSGHTHALQMQIGHFSPAAWFMPEWGGLYTEGTQQLYVSTGIGGSVPYRLGAWPTVEVITLN